MGVAPARLPTTEAVVYTRTFRPRSPGEPGGTGQWSCRDGRVLVREAGPGGVRNLCSENWRVVQTGRPAIAEITRRRGTRSRSRE
jgi:hypothetical protein